MDLLYNNQVQLQCRIRHLNPIYKKVDLRSFIQQLRRPANLYSYGQAIVKNLVQYTQTSLGSQLDLDGLNRVSNFVTPQRLTVRDISQLAGNVQAIWNPRSNQTVVKQRSGIQVPLPRRMDEWFISRLAGMSKPSWEPRPYSNSCWGTGCRDW